MPQRNHNPYSLSPTKCHQKQWQFKEWLTVCLSVLEELRGNCLFSQELVAKANEAHSVLTALRADLVSEIRAEKEKLHG